MAAQLTTRPAPFGAITIYRVVNFLSTLSEKVDAWNDARMTRNSLGKLSDHLASLASFKTDAAGKKASDEFKKYLDKQNLGLVIQSTCNILPGDSGGPLV